MRRGLLLVSVIALGLSSASAQDPFVRVEDGRFVLNGSYYYYTGVNYWYGMNLGSSGDGGDRARLVTELDTLAARGLTNLRIMAASEGPNSEPLRVSPTVQPAPREYDENLLRGLDFLLSEMGKRDMKAVLVLNNFFHWSGGMAQYVSWTAGTPIPYPVFGTGEDSWDDFQDYSSRFYIDYAAQRLFLDYVFELIHRENHLTGQLYRDDPTIMAWQLANEPRGFDHSDQYVEWVDKAAGFIQLHDPNHLVSLGGEGKLTPGSGTQFEWVSTSPYLDYITVHIWIENWGWFDPKSPVSTFPTAVGRAMGYLADHVSLARAINKPMVLEAFGVSRDDGSFGVTAETSYRDTYYRILLEALFKLAQEGNVAAGSNVWSWSGTERPAAPGEAWSDRDALTGDPPHEKQGRYSIYDSDRSTVNLLSTYAGLMTSLNLSLEDAASQETADK